MLYAHSQAVRIETADELTADDARNLLMAAPGVVARGRARRLQHPLPREAAGRDDVLVGRIRRAFPTRAASPCGS